MILKSALGLGLGLRPVECAAAQEADPGVDAPQENDLFVFAEGEREGEIIAPGDVSLGGPPVAAFPLDTKSGLVRNGSRLNRVVLIRLAPQEIGEGTRTHSAEGILAYSAVCTHTACDVSTLDSFLVALDARSGKVRWEKPVEDYRKGYYRSTESNTSRCSPAGASTRSGSKPC